MKTFIETQSTLPNIPLDKESQHFAVNPNNPAEDAWLVNTHTFIGDPRFAGGNDDFSRVLSWLELRIHFSMLFGSCISRGFEDSEAQITFRPCNHSGSFRKAIQTSHCFPYTTLALHKAAAEPPIRPAYELAKDILLPVAHSLAFQKEDHQATHFLISYDDDNNLLAAIYEDLGPELYETYCRSKGLENS